MSRRAHKTEACYATKILSIKSTEELNLQRQKPSHCPPVCRFRLISELSGSPPSLQSTWQILRHVSNNADSVEVFKHRSCQCWSPRQKCFSVEAEERDIKNMSIDKYRQQNWSSTTVTKTSSLQRSTDFGHSNTHARAYFPLPINQNMVQVW